VLLAVLKRKSISGIALAAKLGTAIHRGASKSFKYICSIKKPQNHPQAFHNGPWLCILCSAQQGIHMLKKIASLLLTLCWLTLTWAVQPIDLNKATEIELDGLNGVGPTLTQAIMNERQKALFKDWGDVTTRVKGIGQQKASKLSDQGVRVQGKAFTQKPSGQNSIQAAEALKTQAAPIKN
jgi:competence protein ComEA